MGQYNASGRVSVTELSLTVVESFRSVKNKLDNILSRHSALNDTPLVVGLVVPPCDVLLLSWINTAPDCNFLSAPASD